MMQTIKRIFVLKNHSSSPCGWSRSSCKEITATDNWQASFTDLPVYKEGKKIAYTITEDPVAGYTSNIDGFTVTNRHTPPTTPPTTPPSTPPTTPPTPHQRHRQRHRLQPPQRHRQQHLLQRHRRHHQQRRQAHTGKPETPTTPKEGKKKFFHQLVKLLLTG